MPCLSRVCGLRSGAHVMEMRKPLHRRWWFPALCIAAFFVGFIGALVFSALINHL